MKWWLLRILIWLLVGGTVNVLVAWGCALWSPRGGWRGAGWAPPGVSGAPEGAWVSIDPEEDTAWVARRLAIFGEDLRALKSGDEWWFLEECRGTGVWLAVAENRSRISLVAGWPVASLSCHGTGGWPRAWSWERAIAVEVTALTPPLFAGWTGTDWDDKVLPMRPLWRGMAANSLVYALALSSLVYAPGALRRCARRRRGHCISCGYDRRGSVRGVCPECGKCGKAAHV